MWLNFLIILFPLSVFSVEIPFMKPSFFDIPSDIEESRKENKYFFIMFQQEGCPFCEKMRRVTFQNKKVKEFFTKNFYMIEINIKGSVPVIDVDGKEYTEKEFSLKYGARSTPFFVFYDKEGKVILKLPGYYGPEDFLLIGRYIVEEHYKKESLPAFLKRIKK